MRKLLVLGFVLAVALLAHEGAAQPTVVATIPVGTSPNGGPNGVGVNPSTNRIYVSLNSNNVSVIDGATNAVVATIPVGAPWTANAGVGVNPSTNRIYVTNTNSNNVSVIDGASNTVVAAMGVGSLPVAVGVNPSTNRIYVANAWSNNVSVIDGATNAVVATVAVESFPVGVGVKPATDRVYVANFLSDTVSVIDGATDAVVATVPVGDGPRVVGVNPTTDRLYVSNRLSDTVSVIDGATNAVVATIPVGANPLGVGVNPSTNRIYVGNAWSDTVSVIDGATNAVVATVAVGSVPVDVGVNPTTDRVYVANCRSATVSVIADPSDTTPPVITLTTPAEGAVYTLNQVVSAGYTCEDEPGGSGLASCVGDVPDGAAIDTASVGAKTFAVTAEDNTGNVASLTDAYSVVYSFSGFFRPVDNAPTLNLAKAGSAIPVKFSLSGNQGLSIFATGYPKSKEIGCDTSALLDAIEETVTAGSSSLSYDPIADQYVYVWKTDKAWAGTCRQLMVRLDDLTDHVANFKFK